KVAGTLRVPSAVGQALWGILACLADRNVCPTVRAASRAAPNMASLAAHSGASALARLAGATPSRIDRPSYAAWCGAGPGFGPPGRMSPCGRPAPPAAAAARRAPENARTVLAERALRAGARRPSVR